MLGLCNGKTTGYSVGMILNVDGIMKQLIFIFELDATLNVYISCTSCRLLGLFFNFSFVRWI